MFLQIFVHIKHIHIYLYPQIGFQNCYVESLLKYQSFMELLPKKLSNYIQI